MKKCTQCETSFVLDKFGNNKNTEDGKMSTCNECVRDAGYRRKFGITLGTYNKLLLSQNSVCAVCMCTPTSERNAPYSNLAVDHCHLTGNVRGLLCRCCNTALGLLEANPMYIRAASIYLVNDYPSMPPIVTKERKKVKRKNNQTGYLGVYPRKTFGKWAAQITHNKKQVYLGVFNSPKDAAVAYDKYVVVNKINSVLNFK